jgi:hypothetical protein
MSEKTGGDLMSIYKRGIIITATFAVVSIVCSIVLNYCMNEKFWCNVFIGVFGSSLLTLITSFIGYFVERKKCMEGFYTATLRILNQYNRYQKDLSVDAKIEFFLTMVDYDNTSWNMYIGEMDFFNNENKKYIYKKIYTPLKEVDVAISKHAWQFRMHRNGTGRNENVMKKFIEEIEGYILDVKKNYLATDDSEGIVTKTIKNKIVDAILQELDGHYYEIMYGRKIKKQKETKEEDGEIRHENN